MEVNSRSTGKECQEGVQTQAFGASPGRRGPRARGVSASTEGERPSWPSGAARMHGEVPGGMGGKGASSGRFRPPRCLVRDQGLTRLRADLVEHAAARSPRRPVVLDIDNSESPIHGTQERSAYKGRIRIRIRVTSSRSVITRSSFSTRKATALPRNSDRATSTARRDGRRSSCHH